MTNNIDELPREENSTLKNAGYNAYNIKQAVDAGNEGEMIEKISEINGFDSNLAARIVLSI